MRKRCLSYLPNAHQCKTSQFSYKHNVFFHLTRFLTSLALNSEKGFDEYGEPNGEDEREPCCRHKRSSTYVKLWNV